MNKKTFLYFILLFFFSTTFYPIDDSLKYYDTVNARKAIFLDESEWIQYINKNILIDPINKIRFVCNIDNDKYEMRFYVEGQNNKDVYSFGRIDYQFDADKKLLKAKVYFHKANNSYLLFEKGNLGKYDIYLFGKLYRKNLFYFFSFESLKTLSLYKILSLLDDANLRDEVLIVKDDSKLKEKFINQVISVSTPMKYVDDGARDENGNFVYINSENKQNNKEQGINCSGFVKEIADNYIRLINPDFRFLSIGELKKVRENERKNITFQYYGLGYDPFFGRDWAKNISDKINQLCNYNIISSRVYEDDQYAFYDRDRGYDVKDLKEVLYRNQQNDSNYFYLLVFNRLRSEKPVVPEYHHLSIAVPYFEDCHFYLRVFESGVETNFPQLQSYHTNEKVMIIKIPIPFTYL